MRIHLKIKGEIWGEGGKEGEKFHPKYFFEE